MREWGFSTKAIHEGNAPDRETGAIIPPLYQTSTYVQPAPGEHKGYEYTRTQNPTRVRLEECLCSLENANFAVVSSSGMSAAMLVMHALPEGSSVLCGDDVYGGTYRKLTTVFHKKCKIQFIDTTDLNSLNKKIEEFRPSLLWLESPTNPLMKITDIQKTVEVAKKAKTLVLVDNTFMSPYFQNPLDLGADIVLHSMTKYLNGHSDIVGGALLLNHEKLYETLFSLQNSLGPSLSPFDSWLVLRGLKTLALRMKAHEKNALALAEWLEKHPLVERVLYPGCPSHPQYDIAKKQMRGFGGMIAFYLKGDLEAVKKFLGHTKLFALAESLGGVESLIEHPGLMTHASVPRKIRDHLGVTDQLIRLSIGVEDLSDLQADLEEAFRWVS